MDEPTAAVTERQAVRAAAFRGLHDNGIFVMPCAWDAGSARLFETAGFSAIGTTSGGVNWSAGRADYVYAVEREVMLDAYGAVAAAVHLPVSGDLENGYGDSPDDVAATIREAIAYGMVGGSIEDRSSDVEPRLLDIELAVDRIAAAREAADAMDIAFTLTARAESFYGDVADPFANAVERANRYAEAGADCIFVPGPSTLADIARLVDAVDAPVSVGIGSGGGGLTIAALGEVGVRRMSTGGLIPRVLARVVAETSRQLLADGALDLAAMAMPEPEINALHAHSGS